MAFEVFMPKMTDDMEAGVIVNWLAKEGDRVEKGQAILEVETDKAVVELEAPGSGILKGIRAGLVPGASVPVGETIAFVAESSEPICALPPLDAAGLAQTQANVAQPLAEARAVGPIEPSRIRATPAVRRIAHELGVELSRVKGTGPEGRVLEHDVRGFAATRSTPLSQAAERGKTAPAVQRTTEDLSAAQVPSPPDDGVEWQELTRAERLSGQRMVESVQVAPQFALSIGVDMTRAMELRSAVKAKAGERVSVTGILVRFVADALQRHPRVNASFADCRLKIHKHINIGVAVGTDEGLVVPVIRDADRKSLVEICREVRLLQEKAVNRRIGPNDLTGGTFTISNLGMHGVDSFQAILNPPESAILAAGRIIKTPMGMPDDTIALRPIMCLTLTVDHRTMDGIAGAKFLAALKQRLEQPCLKSEKV